MQFFSSTALSTCSVHRRFTIIVVFKSWLKTIVFDVVFRSRRAAQSKCTIIKKVCTQSASLQVHKSNKRISWSWLPSSKSLHLNSFAVNKIYWNLSSFFDSLIGPITNYDALSIECRRAHIRNKLWNLKRTFSVLFSFVVDRRKSRKKEGEKIRR